MDKYVKTRIKQVMTFENLLLTTILFQSVIATVFRQFYESEITELNDMDVSRDIINETYVWYRADCGYTCANDRNCVSYQFYEQPGQMAYCKTFFKRPIAQLHARFFLNGARHFLKDLQICPSERGYRYDTLTGLCFKLSPGTRPYSTYFTANNNCTQEGARLLLLKNAQQWEMIRDLLNTERPSETFFWVSGITNLHDPVFRSVKGPVSYFHWQEDEPNGNYSLKRQCIALRRPDRKMMDRSCLYGQNWICEIAR